MAAPFLASLVDLRRLSSVSVDGEGLGRATDPSSWFLPVEKAHHNWRLSRWQSKMGWIQFPGTELSESLQPCICVQRRTHRFFVELTELVQSSVSSKGRKMGCNKMGLKRRFCNCWFSCGFRSEATCRQFLREAAFYRFLLLCVCCYAPILLCPVLWVLSSKTVLSKQAFHPKNCQGSFFWLSINLLHFPPKRPKCLFSCERAKNVGCQ